MTTSVALKSLLGAAALTLPLMAFGESNLQTGAAALTATAHVDFSIVIPKILYLRVGAGSTYTGATPSLSSVGTIDAITFSPAAGTVGNGAAGDSIPWTQITTSTATLTSGTALPAPVLVNGASASIVLTAPATKFISQDAKWTYAYANSVAAPAGTYGGTAALNGRVTYTASMP